MKGKKFLQCISSTVKTGNLSSLILAVDMSHIGGLSSNATNRRVIKSVKYNQSIVKFLNLNLTLIVPGILIGTNFFTSVR